MEIKINAIKGAKGFQSLPENERVAKVVGVRLNKAEHDTLKTHASETGKSISDVVKEALYLYFKTKQIKIKDSSVIDPNQLDIGV
jgi:hypothetical protein